MGEGDGEATGESPGDGLDVAPEALAEARLDVLGVCAPHAARINTVAARTGPLMVRIERRPQAPVTASQGPEESLGQQAIDSCDTGSFDFGRESCQP